MIYLPIVLFKFSNYFNRLALYKIQFSFQKLKEPGYLILSVVFVLNDAICK